MDRFHGELSAERLINAVDDDATTVQDIEAEEMADYEATQNGMLEHCECGSISCQGRQLQLPASSRTVFESWTLVFRRPTRRLTRWTRLLGCTVVKTTETEPGKIVAVSPNTHFEQEDLAQMVIAAKTQHKPRPLTSRGYDDDLEHRLRKQDETVQNELFSLLRDRTESASNPYRHREYKFAVLEVSGGKMTDASSRPRAKKHWWQGLQKSKYTKASHIEYRVVLRGHEMRANDAGWAVYDRFSQPWRLADEAGLARTREKMGYQTLLG